MNERFGATTRLQPVRRGFFLPRLLVVVAMIVGVLAMHVFTSDMGSHDSPAMSAMSNIAATSGAVMPMPSDGIDATVGPATDPNQIMSTMVCILALILTGLLLAVAWPARGRILFGFIGTTPSSISQPVSVAGPAPPNLMVLSISRV